MRLLRNLALFLTFPLLPGGLIYANGKAHGSRPYYGGGHHTTSHAGSYSGSHGSSHKGGHYRNPKTNDHYGKHK